MRGVDSTQRRASYFFMLPLVLLMVVFVFIPEIGTLILSVSNWKGIGALKANGFENFRLLMNDKIFIQSLMNTVRVGAVSAVLALIIGLTVAISLQSVSATESVFYRTMLFIPVILPLTIVGLLFEFVFNLETGILNQLLRIVGFGSLARAWLSEPKVAIWSITFVEIWKNAGLPMLMIYASLITIPPSIYEAAHIDGASRLQMIHANIAAPHEASDQDEPDLSVHPWIQDIRPDLYHDKGWARKTHDHGSHLDGRNSLQFQ